MTLNHIKHGTTAIEYELIYTRRKSLGIAVHQDGRVIVLGGLIKDDVQDGSQKIPILGDIPFLGRLFRTDAVQVTKSNLMIFIRTTILRDDEQMAGATADKYRYIKDQQELRRARGLMFLDDENLPVLPEWESQIQQLQEIKDTEDAAGDAAAAEGS